MTSDISQAKKSFNSGSFTTKVHNDNLLKNVLQGNINILNVVDSNKDGLVAVCMDQEIGFYAGSQFFEETPNKELEKFPSPAAGGSQLTKIESVKLGFQPL